MSTLERFHLLPCYVPIICVSGLLLSCLIAVYLSTSEQDAETEIARLSQGQHVLNVLLGTLSGPQSGAHLKVAVDLLPAAISPHQRPFNSSDPAERSPCYANQHVTFINAAQSPSRVRNTITTSPPHTFKHPPRSGTHRPAEKHPTRPLDRHNPIADNA
jgi:hypothetical protein